MFQIIHKQKTNNFGINLVEVLVIFKMNLKNVTEGVRVGSYFINGNDSRKKCNNRVAAHVRKLNHNISVFNCPLGWALAP